MASATARAMSVWPARGRKASTVCASTPSGAKAARTASCRFIGPQLVFKTGDFVAQDQTPLLEAAHHELVDLDGMARTGDQGIEIRMLDAQLDQPTRQRMQVGIQESGPVSKTAKAEKLVSPFMAYALIIRLSARSPGAPQGTGHRTMSKGYR